MNKHTAQSKEITLIFTDHPAINGFKPSLHKDQSERLLLGMPESIH